MVKPARPQIAHDRLFKELLGAFLFEFLELFLPEFAARIDSRSLLLVDKELFPEDDTTRRADLVAQARILDGVPSTFLIHCEHEAQNKDPLGFPRRMLGYALALHDGTRMPVYPIALLSYSTPRRPLSSSFQIGGPGFLTLNFQYKVIQLNRLDWRDYAERPNPVAAALMTRMHIDQGDRPRAKLACLRLLRRLSLDASRSVLVGRFVEQYIKLNSQEQARFDAEFQTMPQEEQEAMQGYYTSWEEKGIEIGLAQGLGLGEVKSLKVVLEARFGPASTALFERLDALPSQQVEALLALAATVGSLSEFAERAFA